MNEHKIVVLKGDGIGPEIVDEAIKVLDAAGKKFGFQMQYDYRLMGGVAIDATGVPLPKETVGMGFVHIRLAFVNRVLMRAGERREHKLACIRLARTDFHFRGALVDLFNMVDVGEIQLAVNVLGIHI